jgi:hypothetical protein
VFLRPVDVDPYALLEVPWGAPEAEIRQAFRRLALEYHPDRNPGDAQAEARFKLVSAAFQRLKIAGFILPRPAPSPSANPGRSPPPPPRWSSWGARTYVDDDEEWEPPPRPDYWPDGARIHYPSPEEIARLVRDLKNPTALSVLRPWGDRLLQGAIYAYFGAIGVAVVVAAALAVSSALGP